MHIIPKEIRMVFYNGSNYDFHLFLRELLKEFEGEEIVYLGENT